MAFWPFAHHQQRWTVISGGTDLISAIQTLSYAAELKRLSADSKVKMILADKYAKR